MKSAVLILLSSAAAVLAAPAPAPSPVLPPSLPSKKITKLIFGETKKKTGIPSASSAKSQLAKLTVGSGDEIDGYERDKFKTWIQIGNNCDTRYDPLYSASPPLSFFLTMKKIKANDIREYVLERDGTDVQVDNACKATSGTWTSPYDGKVWKDESDLQIDHMVPLHNAWNVRPVLIPSQGP